MVTHNGLLYVGLATWNCPEPVGMSALRGLEKRGLCESTATHGIFSITLAGRARYVADKSRLVEAINAQHKKQLAQSAEEEKDLES